MGEGGAGGEDILVGFFSNISQMVQRNPRRYGDIE